LDGFRAIAIFLILAHHMRRSLDLDHLVKNSAVLEWVYKVMLNLFNIDLTDGYVWLQKTIWRTKGVLGVEMFFVMSGFLITRILLKGADKHSSFKWFYLRRCLRIYPAYAVMVLLSLAIYCWVNPQPLTGMLDTALKYLLFLQNYSIRNPFLEHTWSLVVTEQFYLIAPVVVVIVYACWSSSRARRNVLIGLCLLFMILVPMVRILFLTTGRPLVSWPYESPFPFLTTMFHLGPIVFGCLLALLEPYLQRWEKNVWWGCVFWITGMSLFMYLSFDKYWDYFVGEWYLYTLGYWASGFLIIAAYHGVSLLARLKVVQWVGRNSYGIYLWHYLPLYFWALWLVKLSPLLVMFLFLVSSLILGVISTNTLERYFLQLREKLAPKSSRN